MVQSRNFRNLLQLNKGMNLSIIAAGITLTVILIFGFLSYKAEAIQKIPDISRFPFNQATGKERSFVNKTGDSSAWIESARRMAIAKAYRPDYCCGGKTIKETQHTTGTTGGAVEAFILSGYGRICADVCEQIVYDGSGDKCIYDGNVSGCPDACDEVIYDGSGGDCVLDGGNNTNNCDEVVYDGSSGDCVLDGHT